MADQSFINDLKSKGYTQNSTGKWIPPKKVKGRNVSVKPQPMLSDRVMDMITKTGDMPYDASQQKSNQYIFPINPISHRRSTKGDGVLFRIPYDKLTPQGRKRRDYLEVYNVYKKQLANIARGLNFIMPFDNFHITFHIEMPKSWSKKKKKDSNPNFWHYKI